MKVEITKNLLIMVDSMQIYIIVSLKKYKYVEHYFFMKLLNGLKYIKPILIACLKYNIKLSGGF